jgi:mRNA interferase RelE/StbE
MRQGKGQAVRFRVGESTVRLLREAHPSVKRKLRAGLDRIRVEPEIGKPLKDEPAGLRSFRVSRFRIIYRISARDIIDIVAIGPRRSIYLETYRLIVKESKSDGK